MSVLLAALLPLLLLFQPTNILCDVFDDAENKLDEFEIFLRKTISTATDNLEDILMDFNYFAVGSDYFGMVKIQEQQDAVMEQLTDLKNNNSNIDISACLNNNESNLQNLPWQSIDSMRACTAATMLEAPEIIRALQYAVDVIYTNVGAIQFQITACDSDECLTAIIDQLNMKTSELAEEIQTKVTEGETKLVRLKETSQACQDDNVEEYINATNAIVHTINECIINL